MFYNNSGCVGIMLLAEAMWSEAKKCLIKSEILLLASLAISILWMRSCYKIRYINVIWQVLLDIKTSGGSCFIYKILFTIYKIIFTIYKIMISKKVNDL